MDRRLEHDESLRAAIRSRDDDAVRRIVDQAHDLGVDLDRALAAAAEIGDETSMRAIWRAGASDADGALIAAAGANQVQVLDLCLDWGATALDRAAAAAARRDHFRTVAKLRRDGAGNLNLILAAAASGGCRWAVHQLAAENTCGLNLPGAADAAAAAGHAGVARFCRELAAGAFWPPAGVLRRVLLETRPRRTWYSIAAAGQRGESPATLPIEVRHAIGEIVRADVMRGSNYFRYPVIYESEIDPELEKLASRLTDPPAPGGDPPGLACVRGASDEWALSVFDVPGALIVDFCGWPGENQAGAVVYLERSPWRMIYLFFNGNAQLTPVNPMYANIGRAYEKRRLVAETDDW
jgi:hypothetical protein